jgi:hypothetical protein
MNTEKSLQSFLEVSQIHNDAVNVLVTANAGQALEFDPILHVGNNLVVDRADQGRVIIGTIHLPPVRPVRGRAVRGGIRPIGTGSTVTVSNILNSLPPSVFSVSANAVAPVISFDGAAVRVSGSLLDEISPGAHGIPVLIDLANRPPIDAVAPPTRTIPLPVKDAAVVARFEKAISDFIALPELTVPVDRGALKTLDLPQVAQVLLKRIDPSVNVPRRLSDMIRVGDKSLAVFAGPRLTVRPTFDRIMVAPEMPAPMYSFLAGYDQERFVPGLGVIPPNSITLLETNPRFIEAFMVGLNYEMNRELLWRGYPTDQRGTPFRFFWQWLDGQPDIPPIHTWMASPPARPGNLLGAHARGAGEGGQLVMLIRGELVRRYPNAVIFAAKPGANAAEISLDEADHKHPVFHGQLPPDVIFAGFDLIDEDLTRDGGWFFVIQEQPTEPRFGFDQPASKDAGPLGSWSDANWLHTETDEGAYIRIAGNPLTARSFGGLRFGDNAAAIAAITLQDPMRVAVHGRYLVK